MVVNAQEAKTDYTDAIVNADLSTTDAWNAEGTKGISGGMVKVSSEAAFDFCQTITLPAGQYKMTAKAAYRYGSDEQAEYDAIQAGTETHLVKLYAEIATKKYEANVQNRYEGASETDFTAGAEKTSTVNNLYVPNASNAVKAWFDNGKYVNELVFDVQEDGQVKIGITRTGGVVGDYVNIGAWTLTRLGDVQEEQVDDVVFTMVQNEADLVAGEKYLIMAEVNGGWVALSDLNAKTPCYNPSDTLAVSENWTVETVVATAVSETVGLFLGAPYFLTLEGAAGAWKFKDEVNGAYLYWKKDKNALGNDAEGTKWNISFNKYAHNAVISVDTLAARTLQYNSSSPRFACYTSTQAPVYLFKAGEVSVAPVAPSNPSFTSIGELLAFEVGNMVELVLSDAKITYLKGNNMSITDGVDTIAVYDYNIPAGYAVDGLLSGKVTATLSEYKGNKQLTVVDWSEAKMATDYIVNGTFDTAIEPWQTTTGAQNKALASNQTGAFNVPFYENWNPSSFTGKMYQVIDSIPNGVYELSICAFVSAFDASAQYVYANSSKVSLVAGAPTAYVVPVVVVDGTLEVGLEQTAPVNNWMGIDNVKLYYVRDVTSADFVAEYDKAIAKAKSLADKAMDPAILQKLNEAIENYSALDASSSVEELVAAIEALKIVGDAEASVAFYASNKAAIDAMYTLMESTNVYSAEAYLAYRSIADNYKAQYEAGTLTGTVDNPATVHGWHASVDYDDLLLSLWGTKDYDTNLYINTWSTEGETDGSEFKVPFFEYWTGDDASLGATTKSATITDLVPGASYTVSAWVRVRAKNGVNAADATGISFVVGADTVDVTNGNVVGATQMSHDTVSVVGVADAEGNLTISFVVAADNNISWLSYKDVKYSPAEAKFLGGGVLASVAEGNHYVYYTDAEGGYHFLNAAGENNWVLSDTPTLIEFSDGNITDAYAGAASFMNSNGYYMSNAEKADGTGAIKTELVTGSNGANKRTWESQVFYVNAGGKYAIRLTNSTGTSWGANCFANVDAATLAVVSGQPSLEDALYVWEIADEYDPRFTSKFVYNLDVEREAGLGYAADEYTIETSELAALMGLDSLTNATIWGVNPDGSFVADAMATYDGWRSVNGTFADWSSETAAVCVKLLAEEAAYLISICTHADNGNDPVAGTLSTASWALTVGEDTMMININITFVEPEIFNIADFEIVSTITVAAQDSVGVGYSGATATFDATAAATALGLSSLTEAEQYILNVTTGDLVYNSTDGWRDANGDAANHGAENGVCVKINDPASGLVDFIGQMPGSTYTAGQTYTAKWAFVHEGKAVVIEVVITFVDGSGIENLATDKAVTVYTVGGRAIQTTISGVNALEKGIYIVNGKKVYVK